MLNRAATGGWGWRRECGIVLLAYLILRCMAPAVPAQRPVRRTMATRATATITVEGTDPGNDSATPADSRPQAALSQARTEFAKALPSALDPKPGSGRAFTPLRI